MRLRAEQHLDLGRAVETARLDVPAFLREHRVPRGGERGEVREGGAGRDG